MNLKSDITPRIISSRAILIYAPTANSYSFNPRIYVPPEPTSSITMDAMITMYRASPAVFRAVANTRFATRPNSRNISMTRSLVARVIIVWLSVNKPSIGFENITKSIEVNKDIRMPYFNALKVFLYPFL